jgi:hypothetical protein
MAKVSVDHLASCNDPTLPPPPPLLPSSSALSILLCSSVQDLGVFFKEANIFQSRFRVGKRFIAGLQLAGFVVLLDSNVF